MIGAGVTRKQQLVFDARDFGAVGNGTDDDTAAIQAAIDAAGVAGGEVYLAPGTYKLTSSLIIASVHGVGLGGPIGSGWSALASGKGGAILNWAAAGGAAPMLIIRPAVDSEYWPAHNVRIENLAFQGNDVATQGIHMEALKLGVFRNLTLFAFTDAAIWAGGTSVSGYISNQHTYNCVFENIEIDQFHGAGTGMGMKLGQTTPDARFFFNSFCNIHFTASTGVALDLIAVDHCTFDLINIGSVSTYGVVLEGQAVNYNVFLNLWPGVGGFLARGTADGTSGASGRNTIFGYSTSDSAPLPVIKPGAGLVVYYHNGRPTPLKALTHATNAANADYYVKLASGSLTAQFQQQSGSAEFSSYAGSVGHLAHVDFRVYQGSAINGSNQPTVDLLVQQKKTWVAADFSIVVTNVTTTVDWELWAKIPGTSVYVLTTPQADYTGDIAWLESETPVVARTAGTATAGTSV